MPAYTIPNTPDTTYGDLAEPDARDFEILGQQTLYGVLSGCQVGAQGPATMSTDVGSGVILNNGVPVSVASTSVTHAGAGTNPRVDMVVVDSLGNASVVAGLSSTNARCSALPGGLVVLAFVYVPGGASSIQSAQIVDKRLMLALSFSRSGAIGVSILGARIDGDTFDRWTKFADGSEGWGGGALAQDVTLTRTAAGELTLVGNLITKNIKRGTGSPETVVVGAIGDLFVRTDGALGTVVYYKSSAASPGNTGWLPLGAKKTVVIPHTWAIGGPVAVAIGDFDYICPFFVPVPAAQTATLLAVRHRINSGTSATVKLQKNGVDVTGFTGISVTPTITHTDPADVALADGDMLALVVSSISGSPMNLSITLEIAYTF